MPGRRPRCWPARWPSRRSRPAWSTASREPSTGSTGSLRSDSRVGDVRRIKIWAADGTIVYSDEARLIGETFALGEDELEVLMNGGTEAEVSDLDRAGEPLRARRRAAWSRSTRRSTTPEGEPLLFEAYFSDGADRRAPGAGDRAVPADHPRRAGLLVVVATGAAVGADAAGRRRAAAERERLLRARGDASDAERRRIARDLHDGVVQDLAGSAFAVVGHWRATADEPARAALLDTPASRCGEACARCGRCWSRSTRPTSNAATLAAALEDLLAPAAAAGVRVTVDVDGLDDVRRGDAALIWRVAQEAVRNTLRHAQRHRR